MHACARPTCRVERAWGGVLGADMGILLLCRTILIKKGPRELQSPAQACASVRQRKCTRTMCMLFCSLPREDAAGGTHIGTVKADKYRCGRLLYSRARKRPSPLVAGSTPAAVWRSGKSQACALVLVCCAKHLQALDSQSIHLAYISHSHSHITLGNHMQSSSLTPCPGRYKLPAISCTVLYFHDPDEEEIDHFYACVHTSLHWLSSSKSYISPCLSLVSPICNFNCRSLLARARGDGKQRRSAACAFASRMYLFLRTCARITHQL